MDDTRGDWRPAIYTRRRHYVPAGSPTRPYQSWLLGSGLCGCPGFLDGTVRPRTWPQWKFCQYCLALWLKDWPPHGYHPTDGLTNRYAVLSPLHDWWWRPFGPASQPRLRGFHPREDGTDVLWVCPDGAELQRLNPSGVVYAAHVRPVEQIVTLLSGQAAR